MKYAITGHTSGIGKTLFKILSPDCLGFSRSTGYDITEKENRLRIIKEVDNCDIFINNANDEFGQIQMFIELFKQWQGRPKTIVNVGSAIIESSLIRTDDIELLAYQSQKLILRDLSFKTVGLCKVRYVSFGYVGTSKILAKYPHLTERDYITEEHAARIILEHCG